MPFKEIANDGEFTRELASAGAGRLVVVDFFAVWCGPCTMIAPFFKQLSNTFPQVLFLKVDVDKCDQAAQGNRITAMPTFVFFKNSREIERIRGGNKQELEDKVRQHAAASSAEAGGEAGGAETGAANGFVKFL
jgi:thioredoxin